MKFLYLAIILSGLFSSQRYYVWTYGNQMMEKGEAELEFYNTYEEKGWRNTIKQYLELEVGMNDRLDAGFYFRYSIEDFNSEELPSGMGTPDMTEHRDVHFDGYKLKVRWRLFGPDKVKLNPILYFESYMDPDFSITKLEHKLILTKDWESFNIALNPTIEFEIDEEETEVELYSAMSYKLNRVLRLGFECKLSEYGDYIGPTFSHGSENIFISFGFLKAIRKESDQPDQMIRFILGTHI